MRRDIEVLIARLKSENGVRNAKMNSGKCTEYNHTVLVHQYNLTIEFINSLEAISKVHCD